MQNAQRAKQKWKSAARIGAENETGIARNSVARAVAETGGVERNGMQKGGGANSGAIGACPGVEYAAMGEGNAESERGSAEMAKDTAKLNAPDRGAKTPRNRNAQGGEKGNEQGADYSAVIPLPRIEGVAVHALLQLLNEANTPANTRASAANALLNYAEMKRKRGDGNGDEMGDLGTKSISDLDAIINSRLEGD